MIIYETVEVISNMCLDIYQSTWKLESSFIAFFKNITSILSRSLVGAFHSRPNILLSYLFISSTEEARQK